jgi:hypothetical protein
MVLLAGTLMSPARRLIRSSRIPELRTLQHGKASPLEHILRRDPHYPVGYISFALATICALEA